MSVTASALALAILTPVIGSTSASSATASDDAKIVVALTRCLAAADAGAPAPSDAATVPPGLIDGKAVAIQPLPTARQRAVSYTGTGARSIDCGVAVWGRVTDRLAAAMTRAIERSSRFRRGSPNDWKPDAPSAHRRYWGDPKAPGLIGVLMLQREPSRRAPSLEVQYHRLLVP